MASEEFTLTILTPNEELASVKVTEVVLPSYNGEVGILAKHENFVGLLGTGACKFVKNGNDYWVLISGGAYEVKDGNVILIAQFGEEPQSEIDLSTEREKLRALDSEIEKLNLDSPEAKTLLLQHKRTEARIDVYRRTELVN